MTGNHSPSLIRFISDRMAQLLPLMAGSFGWIGGFGCGRACGQGRRCGVVILPRPPATTDPAVITQHHHCTILSVFIYKQYDRPAGLANANSVGSRSAKQKPSSQLAPSAWRAWTPDELQVPLQR